jgi:hypothetical protein
MSSRNVPEPCASKVSEGLVRKYAERDALLDWLDCLEREGAGPEARMIVRAQLDRVLHDIAELQEVRG